MDATRPEPAPCIWMSAGLISYKLCDRDYDCERCPLDAALRGPAAPAPRRDVEDDRPGAWRFPRDRRYSRQHGWARPCGGGVYRIGLDDFASYLMEPLSHVALPIPSSRIRKGRPACWFGLERRIVPFRSPMTGTVVRVNQGIRQLPSLLTRSPYEDGWLAEVRCFRSGCLSDLLTAEEIRRRTAGQLERISAELAGRLGRDAAVGPKLQDGGVMVTLHRLLGTDRYHRLVLSLLG